jgi:[acyl-carrier-protein] S-malonyltransferase
MRVIVFPGQGSQLIGMGKDFYDSFPTAKEVFQEVDEALHQNLSQMIFHGRKEELNLTENTQPALLAVSIAIYRVFCQEGGIKSPQEAAIFMAGHSLGEYTALCAAEALSLTDAVQLVKKRGLAMQQAVPLGQGAMSALLGPDLDQTKKLIKEAGKLGICEIANDNCPGQIVISGETLAIELAEKISKDFGCKKAIRLPVSAPFHSSLMKPAAEIMEKELTKVKILQPKVPVFSNYTAQANQDSEKILELLVKQIYKPVLWRNTIENIIAREEQANFLEIGASKVLIGLIKRILPDSSCANLEKIEDLVSLIKCS